MLFRPIEKPDYNPHYKWKKAAEEMTNESKYQNHDNAVNELLDLIAQLIAREHYQNQIRSSKDDEPTPRDTSEDSPPPDDDKSK